MKEDNVQDTSRERGKAKTMFSGKIKTCLPGNKKWRVPRNCPSKGYADEKMESKKHVKQLSMEDPGEGGK